MPIQIENIKFLKSQVMDDVPEGGGASTGTQIIDGEMNNIFEDISDTDRAYGRFNLRKIFLGVESLDTSLFGGAKTVITALPVDESISYTLFATGDPFDVRSEAADRVESYLYKSTTWGGYLNENHISGMTAISLIQKVGSVLPPIGKTLCIVQNEGSPSETEQYVRVIDVSTADVVFEDDKGKYSKMIVTLTLSDALRYSFLGHSVDRLDSNYSYTNKARIRDTRVADATRYYSSQPLIEAASVGDFTVKAQSAFTQLVPSAQSETPLVNKTLSPTVAQMKKTRANTITFTLASQAIEPNSTIAARSGIYPGTLQIAANRNYIDDGNGVLLSGATEYGIVLYETGEIIFNDSISPFTSSLNFTYIPAAPVSQQAHTLALSVTAENRRLNWVETLLPIPATSSLTVSYMALGNWYTLQDDGLGNLIASDPSIGAGSISYVTGAMLVSLGALPDAGSEIIITWGSPAHYVDRSSGAGIAIDKEFRFELGESIKPGEFEISWMSDDNQIIIICDESGLISSSGVGAINYATGSVAFTTDFFPDSGTTFDVIAKKQTQVVSIKTGVAVSGGLATINLGEAILAGSLKAEWDTVSTKKSDSVTTTYKYNLAVDLE